MEYNMKQLVIETDQEPFIKDEYIGIKETRRYTIGSDNIRVFSVLRESYTDLNKSMYWLEILVKSSNKYISITPFVLYDLIHFIGNYFEFQTNDKYLISKSFNAGPIEYFYDLSGKKKFIMSTENSNVPMIDKNLKKYLDLLTKSYEILYDLMIKHNDWWVERPLDEDEE